MTASNLAERVDSTANAASAEGEALAKTNAAAVTAAAMTTDQRISPLEKSRYEQAGRGDLAGPLQMAFAALVGGLAIWVIQQLLAASA